MAQHWQAIAFNQVPHSANEIHGDKVARQYGFKGGLVPGVTVSAYLCHPAVEQWGQAWLARGSADVNVLSPLYDGEAFEVQVISDDEQQYQAQLVRGDGTVSARATVSLPDEQRNPQQPVPVLRGDPIARREWVAPKATPETMRQLQQDGCRALRYRWSAEHEMHTYLRDETAMPALLQVAQGGLANPSFVLGCSNWVLARNAYMNPWVHMATRSTHYAAITLPSEIIAEMQIVDLFNKKGHEFVDAEVALYDLDSHQCYARIELRAIYQLRGLA